jgi:iturin family lipopeptide synthetase A
METNKKSKYNGLEIAVIGMAGRFADAVNLTQYWSNLVNGVESISFLTDEEIKELGVSNEMLNHPGYVRCKGGAMTNKEYFDAHFFKYLPNEAEILAPQTRIFHECAWEALEDAGYDSTTYNGTIGLYAGSSSVVLWEALVDFSGMQAGMDRLHSSNLSSKEFLCSQTSYKMKLTGPSVYVQTACSTSLVAINNACRSLLTGECTMALSGGVSFSLMNTGYVYEEGMISSKDGHVRAFDSKATGSVSGEGAGVVVLKLLKNAIKDGDNIHAIIKSSYTNNDGDEKVGFTAPGVNGQAKVIRSAMRMAGVEPESISYLETHGTATALGDITEMEALKLAYNTAKRNYCAIGSVKTNIGHCDAAAGVAGFIKTVLALKHKQIPPSLNFEKPNPHIGFERSPFYVNTQLKKWENSEYPLRAGVSSFGIGGTNAHVILEEAPAGEASSGSRPYKLVLLSARTSTALDSMADNLAKWLQENKDADLADVCYTLQAGRKEFPFRRKLLCENTDQAISALLDVQKKRSQMHKTGTQKQKLVFMFSGLGSQYLGMCKDLYSAEPVFKDETDKCISLLHELTGQDLKPVLFAASNDKEIAHDIETGQYLVFIIEYAIAKLLMSWGVKPSAIIGYSFGEYVAACIAGVFNVEDALRIIHKRGQLMKSLPAGMMLSVPLPANEIALNEQLSLAIDNGSSCVVSGPEEAIVAFEETIKEKRLMSMRLDSTRAVHSHMMESVMEELQEFIENITLNAPGIPYISNVTGDWITDTDATDPQYWAKHLRHTVQFYKGVKTLLNTDKYIYAEVGPGGDISALVNREMEQAGIKERALNFVKPEGNSTNDGKYLINKLGQLWQYGVQVDWTNYYKGEKRHRVSLPTYPFERKRYWKVMDNYKAGNFNLPVKKQQSANGGFYLPTWKRAFLSGKSAANIAGTVLVFKDTNVISESIMNVLESENVISVAPGDRYLKLSNNEYVINPSQNRDYEALFADLKKYNRLPEKVIHLLSLGNNEVLDEATLAREQELGYYSLLFIAQALSVVNDGKNIALTVIANGVLEVTGSESLHPAKSTILGPVRVIPQEMPDIKCRYIDIEITANVDRTARAVCSELAKPITEDNILALRGEYIWLPEYEQASAPKMPAKLPRLKHKGVYLLTGGLGGIALCMADFLAKEVNARMLLIGRSGFPHESQWQQWLDEHAPENVTSEKIRQLQQIQKNGGEVMVMTADIADKNALQAAIAAAEQKWGKINGVIHSATVPDGAMIAVREKKMSEDIFRAKLNGTVVTDELLKDNELDFVFYFSTISSILGSFGQVGYCAGNIFQDSFARYRSKHSNVFSVSINWDRWMGVGISKIAEKKHEELMHEKLSGGMDVPEALDCFTRILCFENISQVAVSKSDLATAIAESKKSIPNIIDIEPVAGVELSAKSPRPDLSEEYVAPANELEAALAQMWQAFFGIEPIGVNDNFFELGGDSLKSMVLVKRMKKDLQFDAGIKLFFSKPTIRKIAEEIADVRLLLQTKERSSKITI